MALKSNYWGTWGKITLVDYKGDLSKPWFVKFQWKFHGERKSKPLQLRDAINERTTIKARREFAARFMVQVDQWLQDDWNPKTKEYYVEPLSNNDEWANKLLDTALHEALENIRPTISEGTFTLYEYKKNNFIQAYKALNLAISVKDVKRSTVTTILGHTAKMKGLSNKSYNTYIDYLGPIFAEIAEKADLPISPMHRIKKRPVTESEGFIPPTDKELKEIKKAYKVCKHPEAIKVIETCYHTGIRYMEILKLYIEDIKLIEGQPFFKIVPDKEKGNSKTKSIRWVPINKPMWKLLESMNLDLYPSDWLIFGKKGNKYFVPAPVPIKSVMLTLLWNEVVRKGLGYKCHQYGVKHKGGNDKTDAGISNKSIQLAFGHSSERMTERYTKNALIKKMAKEFQGKSPDF